MSYFSDDTLSQAWKSGYAQAKEEAAMERQFCPHCNPCLHDGGDKCRAPREATIPDQRAALAQELADKFTTALDIYRHGHDVRQIVNFCYTFAVEIERALRSTAAAQTSDARDGARYRWLAGASASDIERLIDSGDIYYGRDLTAAIDAALTPTDAETKNGSQV